MIVRPGAQDIEAAVPESPDQAFARLAIELSQITTVDQTAAQIVAFAMRTIGTQYAGITMIRRRGTFETVSPSAPAVAEADRRQYDLHEGPCVDAAGTSRTVLSTDLAADERWPSWGPAAVALGFHSVLSAQLHAGGGRIGTINFYGPAERRFSRDDVDVAQLFAAHSAAALASVMHREGLQNALDSRTTVGQAQGVLMERFGVDADRAFSILRRYSQDGNRKVTEVSRRLIETLKLPDDLLPTDRSGSVAPRQREHLERGRVGDPEARAGRA